MCSTEKSDIDIIGVRPSPGLQPKGTAMFDTIHGDVKQYPYRSADVRDVLVTVPRKLVEALEEHLAEKAGVRIDNHTVYEIRQLENELVYILFHDEHAIFARELVEGSW